ncbi:MAG: hypothetical protein ACFE68_03090 [Candidatus Hodarchaeota archaeon]
MKPKFPSMGERRILKDKERDNKVKLSEKTELIKEFSNIHERILLLALREEIQRKIDTESLAIQLYDYTTFLKIQKNTIKRVLDQIQSWFDERAFIHKLLISFVKNLRFDSIETVVSEKYGKVFLLNDFIEFISNVDKSREKIVELLISTAELENVIECAKRDQEKLEIYLEIIEYDEEKKDSLVERFLKSFVNNKLSEAKLILQKLKENYEHFIKKNTF